MKFTLWKYELISWMINTIKSLPVESIKERELIEKMDLIALKSLYDKRLIKESLGEEE